jgi:intracellular septation protein
MKTLLFAARPVIFDVLGVIVFAALLALHVDLFTAVDIGVATAIGVVAWELAHRRRVPTLQWTSLALMLVSAAATYLTHDPRFVMVKPTIGYTIVGCLLLRPGWMNRYMPAEFLPLVEGRMMLFGYLWAGLMFITAGLNLVVAVAFTAHWPAFIAAFPIASKLALFAVQYIVIRTAIRGRIAAARVAAIS